MYKEIKLTRNHSIAFHAFPKTAKTVSRVYLTGIRNWVAQDSFNYSIVLGRFRVIYSIERNIGDCRG